MSKNFVFRSALVDAYHRAGRCRLASNNGVVIFRGAKGANGKPLPPKKGAKPYLVIDRFGKVLEARTLDGARSLIGD